MMDCLHLWPFAEPTLALAQSIIMADPEVPLFTPVMGGPCPLVTPHSQKQKRPSPRPGSAGSSRSNSLSSTSIAVHSAAPRLAEIANHGLLLILRDVLQASIDHTGGRGIHVPRARRSIDAILRVLCVANEEEGQEAQPPFTRLRLPTESALKDLPCPVPPRPFQ
jgi:hypothetical protein